MKLAKLAPTYEYGNDLCSYKEMFNEKERKHIADNWDKEFKPESKEQISCKRSIFIGVFFDDTGCNFIDD